MRKLEGLVNFEDKTPQLLWRGDRYTAPHWPGLVKATESKDYVNVSTIDWIHFGENRSLVLNRAIITASR